MASVSIICPSFSSTHGVVRNRRRTAGHHRYICSHCRDISQHHILYNPHQHGTSHHRIVHA
ncbi:IS1 family transposase, partial [Escherichia coli]|uniref:IS1 family transposase n=1 Tax=Escherichia coli TaxID=562 RepID=UPI003CC7FF76